VEQNPKIHRGKLGARAAGRFTRGCVQKQKRRRGDVEFVNLIARFRQTKATAQPRHRRLRTTTRKNFQHDQIPRRERRRLPATGALLELRGGVPQRSNPAFAQKIELVFFSTARRRWCNSTDITDGLYGQPPFTPACLRGRRTRRSNFKQLGIVLDMIGGQGSQPSRCRPGIAIGTCGRGIFAFGGRGSGTRLHFHLLRPPRARRPFTAQRHRHSVDRPQSIFVLTTGTPGRRHGSTN